MGNKKGKDHLCRLPEELIIYIFERVSDLKSLCLCSLVSKYFGSIISHVRTVTITLSYGEPYSKEYSKKMLTVIHEIQHLKSEQIPAFLDQLSLQNLKMPVFMQKFSQLESIYVDYMLDNSSLVKWKVNCKSNQAIIENFVALLPASVHKKTEYELDQQQVRRENSSTFRKTQLRHCIRLSLGRYIEWFCLISILVKSHSSSLQCVTVADSEKHGKLVMKDEQVASMRNCLHKGEWDQLHMKYDFKVAWIPLLELPLSGYVMRDVCLVILTGKTKSREKDSRFHKLMSLDYEEQEMVLGEAVKEFVKNHRHRIYRHRV